MDSLLIIAVKLPGGAKLELCWCPAGSFQMGEDGEKVSVRLTQGYWMGKYPVTQGQWRAVMGDNPSNFGGDDRLPVESVSWDDAQEFLSKVNRSDLMKSGWKLVLPTEAQWEYACRAGADTEYWWGDSCNGTECNCDGNYPHNTERKGPYLEKKSPVGRYGENPWGLCDTHGNVDEWCSDWYWNELGGGVDPRGPRSGAIRVIRGGCWGSSARHCRAATRYGIPPGNRIIFLGFRVAAVPAAEP